MSCSKYVVKISSEKDMKIVAPPHTIPGTVSQGHLSSKCLINRHYPLP